jgi:hypothetical protein
MTVSSPLKSAYSRALLYKRTRRKWRISHHQGEAQDSPLSQAEKKKSSMKQLNLTELSLLLLLFLHIFLVLLPSNFYNWESDPRPSVSMI